MEEIRQTALKKALGYTQCAFAIGLLVLPVLVLLALAWLFVAAE